MVSRLCTCSAANGYKAMAELLLTKKAEVNAKDNNGSPPLHQVAAAAGRHSDRSEIMLAHGPTSMPRTKWTRLWHGRRIASTILIKREPERRIAYVGNSRARIPPSSPRSAHTAINSTSPSVGLLESQTARPADSPYLAE